MECLRRIREIRAAFGNDVENTQVDVLPNSGEFVPVGGLDEDKVLDVEQMRAKIDEPHPARIRKGFRMRRKHASKFDEQKTNLIRGSIVSNLKYGIEPHLVMDTVVFDPHCRV